VQASSCSFSGCGQRLPQVLFHEEAPTRSRSHYGENLGTGLISTIAALVLGLVIASAKSSYDTQKSQVQHITADIILLDQLLAWYGPENRAMETWYHPSIT
jgi:hypothetical protein